MVATTIYAGLRDLIQTTLPLVNRGQPLHGDSLVPNLAASVAYVPNQVGVGSGMVELASPSGASAAHSQFSPGRTLGNDVARGAFGFAGELTDAMVANTAHAYKEGVPLNMHIEPRNPLPHLPQVFTGIGAARPNWLNLAVLGPGLLDQCLAADSSAAQVADMLGQHLPGAEKCVGTAMRLAEKFKNIPTTALEAASLSLFYTPFMMQGQPQRPALPPAGPDV